VRVVTANLHANVDGWGRPTRALDTAIALRPTVLVCPELWRSADDDFVVRLEAAGLRGHVVNLATAERVAMTTPAVTSRRWQPWTAHFTGEQGLYYGGRTFTRPQRATRSRQVLTEGSWGLGLFSTLPLRDVTVIELGRLPRERVRRVAITATLEVEGRTVRVTAVHGAHLSHGSPLWFARLRRALNAFTDTGHAVVAGDFNAWTPVVRLFLPGWTPRAKGRTWPWPRPHSQIDHVLTQGPWRVTDTGTADGGSDHRALFVDLDLA
jgi:endonuclease/exonuclease/phosphatase family metal-dependent hydrolase